VSAEMVHEALQAQTAAISALTEELQLQRKSMAQPDKKRRGGKADGEPAAKTPWYYR
jgi:hypothetical protein